METAVPHPPAGPLDPDARVVIDRLNALNAPGYESMPPKAARAIAAMLRRNAPYPKVKVGAVDTFDLATEVGPLKVRHYRPFLRARPAPTLIYFHGGGWVLGDLETMDHLCRTLVRQGGVDVISVDYPLAPESQVLATVEACAAAVRAIFEQAEALGLDPERIAVGGDSAGGNLAAVMALLARQGDLPGLKAQVLIYPVLDLREGSLPEGPGDTMFMRRETMDWFSASYLGAEGDAGDWRASPAVVNDLRGLAPAYVMTAGHDVLRDQGLDYAARLKGAGVAVVVKDYPGQIHNFVAMPYAIPTAYAALADIAEFLIDRLTGQAGV